MILTQELTSLLESGIVNFFVYYSMSKFDKEPEEENDLIFIYWDY